MKKSDLKSYIRENIIEILSEEEEETEGTIKAKADAYRDLANAKKEAGIEEEVSPTIRQKKRRPNAS